MKPSDYLAVAFLVGFGLWFVVFPANVIRFYTWFHKGQIRPLSAPRVRIAGAMWIFLIVIVLFFTFRNH